MYTSIVLVTMLGSGTLPAQPPAYTCAGGVCRPAPWVAPYRGCPGGVCAPVYRPRYYPVSYSYLPVRTVPSYGGFCPTCYGAYRPISYGAPAPSYYGSPAGTCPGGVCYR